MSLLTVFVDGCAKGEISVHDDIDSHACSYCVADLLGIGVSEILSLCILDQCAYVKLATELAQLLCRAPFISVSSARAKQMLASVFGDESDVLPTPIDAEQLALCTGTPTSNWELWSKVWHYSVGNIKVVRFES